MKTVNIAIFSIIIAVCSSCSPAHKRAAGSDPGESLKQSLVNLRVTVSSYEQFQPWKKSDVAQLSGYGCAVAPYMILTTAENVANAAVIQIRRYDKTDFISATIKAIDYEYNLCLLELNKDEAGQPFKPITFGDIYSKGKELSIYWLATGGSVTDARGILDRAQCESNPVSYNNNLFYILTNPSRATSRAEVVLDGGKAIGIVGFSGRTDIGVIPAEYINRFLTEAQKDSYKGFGDVGFEAATLLDPAARKYLKLPADVQNGIYVSKVYTLGTGTAELKAGDVIMSIDGYELNPYGKYLHNDYDRISYHHLIGKRPVGEKIPFVVLRDGVQLSVDVEVRDILTNSMLVPHYDYDQQPEYYVVGGYVFQKLTRDYFKLWGENWLGKAPPHLLHYCLDEAFSPSEERKEIILLSYVLPAPINLGYQDLGRLVVSKWNGVTINSFADIETAHGLNPEQPFDVVEFEMDNPKVVIPRQYLEPMDEQIAKIYGIQKMKNIRK
jgi:hypothetical protein